MDIWADIPEIITELDRARIACAMSYQAVADACDFSKSTVCRILNGQTEPTVQQLQAIAAAVQYKPPTPMVVPEGFTPEAHISYLKELLQRRQDDNDRHVRQLQAHYNRLHRQDRRTILVVSVLLGILIVFICALFLYDFTHMDRGWIQEELERHYGLDGGGVDLMGGGNIGDILKLLIGIASA